MVGYILAPFLFALVGELLFSKTVYAPQLLVLFYISLSAKLCSRDRNEFLKMNFAPVKYHSLRLIENALVAIPFILFLGYKSKFEMALATLLTAVMMVFYTQSAHTSMVVPTPYGKRLFEFAQGFRRTYVLYVVLAILVVLGITYSNFSLGAFALGLSFLVFGSYYHLPENELYIWNFNFPPRRFLQSKIRTACVYSTLTILPIMIALLVCFPENHLPILAIYIVGVLYVILSTLAKYASYPSEIIIPHGILIAVGVALTPISLIVIGYFYRRAISKLTPLLL